MVPAMTPMDNATQVQYPYYVAPQFSQLPYADSYMPAGKSYGDDNKVEYFVNVAIALGCVSSLICVLTLIAILLARRPIGANLQFVFSLLCSDLLTSISVIGKLSYEVGRSTVPSTCVTIFVDGLRMTAHIAAFFNLCLIAVDMYVAILHPLRYSAIIDSRVVKILVSVGWSLAFLLGFSALYMPSKSFSAESTAITPFSLSALNESHVGFNNSLRARRKQIFGMRNESSSYYAASDVTSSRTSYFQDYCNYVFHKEYDSLFAALTILILAAVVMVSIYGKIFCTIKRIHKTADVTAKIYGVPCQTPKEAKRNWTERLLSRIKKDQRCASASAASGNQSNSSESTKTRRGLVTTMLILAVFCLCFLPYFLGDAASNFIAFKTQLGPADMAYIEFMSKYTFFLFDVLMLNSILDPVIYALRMREVRIGYRRLFGIKERFRRRNSSSLATRNSMYDTIGHDMTASGTGAAGRRGVGTNPDLINRPARCGVITRQDSASAKLIDSTGVSNEHDRVEMPSRGSGEVAIKNGDVPLTNSTSVNIDCT